MASAAAGVGDFVGGLSQTVEVQGVDYDFTFCCHSNYDPLPDGSGFYMSVREGGSAAEVILIEGLISELREKLGN